LRPLGPEHNDSDYAAWTSSIEHIHRTPGYEGATWPHPMSIEQNRRDLESHAADFAARKGFTYTVLAGEGTVIGCVYIYPSEKPEFDVRALVGPGRGRRRRPRTWRSVTGCARPGSSDRLRGEARVVPSTRGSATSTSSPDRRRLADFYERLRLHLSGPSATTWPDPSAGSGPRTLPCAAGICDFGAGPMVDARDLYDLRRGVATPRTARLRHRIAVPDVEAAARATCSGRAVCGR
jgi:hypothetical protein